MLTALTIGLIGSFHCIGMCGPIALAMPVTENTRWGKIKSGIAYNGGRVFTYAVLGLVFGMLGKGLVLAGWQQAMTIAVGAIMILSVVLPLTLGKRLNPNGFIMRRIGFLKQRMAKLLNRKSLSGILMLGILNGFLPCGLVYIAVAGAIATGSAFEGAAFLAMFGVGTVPAMFALYYAGHSIPLNIRNKIRKAIPVLVILIGALFIIRGLDLGIPYLSPEMAKDEPVVHNCCVKPH